MTLARGVFEDLSPPHKPPFTGGLSPLPLPDMTPDERRVMALLGALEAMRSGTTLVLEDANDDRRLRARPGRHRPALPARASAPRTAPAPRSAIRRLRARPRARRAALATHRGDLHSKLERQGRRPHPHRRLGLGARHVLARAAADLRALQKQARHLATIHLNQIWGEVAAVRGASQPAADRVPGRSRLPQRPADLRPLPLHGAARGEALGDARSPSPSMPRSRRAAASARASPTRASTAAPSPWAPTTWPRTWSRCAHRLVHGARAPRGRPAAHARAGAALGDAQRLPRVRHADGGWLAAGNKADLIMIDSARAAPGAGAAGRVRLRAPGSGARRRGRHGRRPLDHARRTRADDRRAAPSSRRPIGSRARHGGDCSRSAPICRVRLASTAVPAERTIFGHSCQLWPVDPDPSRPLRTLRPSLTSCFS